VHRLAAGILAVVSAVLLVGAAISFADYLGADGDGWARLAIVPAVIALVSAAVTAAAALMVSRDTPSGWVAAIVVTIAMAVAWLDFGTDAGSDLPYVVVPALIIGSMAALTIARFTRPPSSR
jgi:hypothetical protein